MLVEFWTAAHDELRAHAASLAEQYRQSCAPSPKRTTVCCACRDSSVPVDDYQPVSDGDFRDAVLPDAAEVLGRAPRSLAEFLTDA